MPSAREGSGRTTKSTKRKRASPKVCRTRKATKPIPSESLDSSSHPKAGMNQEAGKTCPQVSEQPKMPLASCEPCVAPREVVSRKKSGFDLVESLLGGGSMDDEDNSDVSESSHSPDSELENQLSAYYASRPSSKTLSLLLDKMTGQNPEVILSSLEELNDMINMSSEEIVYMLPLARVIPLLFSFLTVETTPLSQALFASRILSLLLESAPPVHLKNCVTVPLVNGVCRHIAEVTLLELSDQCVTILARLSKVSAIREVMLQTRTVQTVLNSMSLFCLATQHHCLEIALDLPCNDANVTKTLIALLEHADTGIVDKTAQVLGACVSAAPLEAAIGITHKILLVNESSRIALLKGLGKWASNDAQIADWLRINFSFGLEDGTKNFCQSMLDLIVNLLPPLLITKGCIPIDHSNSFAPRIFPGLIHTYNRFPEMTLPYALHAIFFCEKVDSKFVSKLLIRASVSNTKAMLFGALCQAQQRGMSIGGMEKFAAKKGRAKNSWEKLIGDQARLCLKTKQSDSVDCSLIEQLEDELLKTNFGFSRLNSLFVKLIGQPVKLTLEGDSGWPTQVMVEPFATVESLKQLANSFPFQLNDEEGNSWDDHELDEEIWDQVEGTLSENGEELHAESRRLKAERLAAQTPSTKQVSIYCDGHRLASKDTLLQVFSRGVDWFVPIEDSSKGPVNDVVSFREEPETALPLIEAIWGKSHALQFVHDEEVSPKQVSKKKDIRFNKAKSLVGRISQDEISDRLSQAVIEIFTLPVFLATRQFPDWVQFVMESCPFVLSVEARRELMAGKFFGTCRSLGARLPASERSLLPLARQKIKLPRQQIVQSASVLMNTYAGMSDAVLEMEFQGEEGTGSGPTNEFYAILAETLKADPTLFRTCPDGSLFPQVCSDRSVLTKWRLLGHLMGRALLDNRLVSLYLSPIFWQLVKGENVSPTLQEIDPSLAKSLDAVLHAHVDVDLTVMPGFESIRFPNCTDPREFVAKVTETSLNVELQVGAFKEAFAEVLPLSVLALWQGSELSVLLAGSSNAAHWKREHLFAHIQTAHGYTRKSVAFERFITILEGLNEEERVNFITFVTGSRSLPLGGFAGLKPLLTVVRVSEGGDAILPSVMTCANFVKLPEYSSTETMKRQLLKAITEGQGSFLLS